MCGGLSCVVVGGHGNGNKLRYSFKVLVFVPEICHVRRCMHGLQR